MMPGNEDMRHVFVPWSRWLAQCGLAPIPLQHDPFLHFVLDLPQQYRETNITR